MPDASAHSAPDLALQLAELREGVARVQHELNNPLAALFAEAQLLAMETSLADEHRQAVERIVDLARRVVGCVRKLDAVRGEETAK